MTTPPIAIVADASVACTTVLWRFRGRLQVTVIIKALFTIVPGGVATVAGPGPIVAEDRLHGGHPARSVEAASDLAPYLARCDVLFTGHAYAPRGTAHSGWARIGVSRDGRPLLDKKIQVFGHRGTGGAPEPFTRLPVVYERALGGPGTPNPAGTTTPNLLDPKDARRPIGFGPIARSWPTRQDLLGEIDGGALTRPTPEVPETMPWGYFQAAPPDQQIELLRGGEWIVLDGLHPAQPRIETRLPPAHGLARVVLRRPNMPAAEHAVDLRCDTLAIDGDRQTFALSWRGQHELAEGEAALPSLLVMAGLETEGIPVDWGRLAARGVKGPQPLARPKVSKETMSMDLSSAIPVLPFGPPNTPASPAPPPLLDPSRVPSSIPGAPWSQVRPASTSIQNETAPTPAQAVSTQGEGIAPDAGRVSTPHQEGLPPSQGKATETVPVQVLPVDRAEPLLVAPAIAPTPAPAAAAPSPPPPPKDPWARPADRPREAAPAPASPPTPAFDRPAAAAVKGSFYSKFAKK